MRLFIGIALASEVSASLRGICARLSPAAADLRWSAPGSWHVTLQFLGQVHDAESSCVTATLAAETAPPSVPVRIDGLGFFDRAGVFYAHVELTPELLLLQRTVTTLMRTCGFTPEARAYSPHITLARTRGQGGAAAFAPLKQAIRRSGMALAAEFTADEYLLYESIPGPEGSRYEVRARFPLAG